MSRLLKNIVDKVDACTAEVRFARDTTLLVEDFYENTKDVLTWYMADEKVEGEVVLKPSKRISHQGIKIELIGQIVVNNDREEKSQFTNQTKQFHPEGGELKEELVLPFVFDCVKPHESYRGLNARVSYFVKVSVIRSVKNITHRQELWVLKLETKHKPLSDNSDRKAYFKEKNFAKGVSMEVGVGDMLHIEFKYDKKLFHLQELVMGQVNFKAVASDMNLQLGEVSIVKREFIGVGDNQISEAETLTKYEIMDGTPIAGELVPIRLYLKSVPRLTPTYELIQNAFSVKYYVNLVLVTGDGKRYFKQQEIIIYRKQ
eukprot:NODE_2596_length_1140_cov_117.951629_g2476_i0.p1 GENE.NODE_2596_length_1140_cov_117.951629_g2476_i0~~NODE_2596_length_1140_cov_117.951629_g2476_i0.p1  ORF type:complete len:333 (+),score=91.67 NODE_2596_length_1140_cov_117.951629_g2476_i0:53-1000(+)